MYKHAIDIALCFMFLCSSVVSVSQAEEPAKTNDNFYIIRSPWDSSFDPHKIIDTWTALTMNVDPKGYVVVVFGNPKIDWEAAIKNNTPYQDLFLPPGEISKLMTYVFVPRKDGQLELYGYGYVAEDGTKWAYRWDGTKYKEIEEAAGKGSI